MNRTAIRISAPTDGLLFGLEGEPLEALLGAAATRQFPAGAALFHQGDAPSHLFQLCTGLVKMTQISSSGAQTMLRLMGPGDVVGCVAVFQQFPFPATATTSQEATAFSWGAGPIRNLIARYPAIAANALKSTGDRAKEMVERVAETTNKDVEQRIASVLLRLAAQMGRAAQSCIDLELPEIRKDIAGMAGVTYFTVSRTLAKWQKQGLVRNGRERILIVAPEKIADIAR